jgi:transglutaminase/protease-like cytokinesis protein 3
MTKKLTDAEKAQNKLDRQAKLNAGKSGKKPKLVKSAKVKPEKAAKAKKPGKASGTDAKAKHGKKGHNSGAVNEALQAIFSDYRKLDEDAKVISKAKRDLIAKAKDEHSVPAANFKHEVKMQKLDNAQRVMFETGVEDLKSSLGIQLAFDLSAGEGEEEEGEGEGVGSAPDPELAARSAAVH